MQDRTNFVAILIADICSSTSLYEVVGDSRASRAITASIDQLSEITIKHGGRVVKSTGDGILSTFNSSDDAFRAALAMQRNRYGADIHVSVGLNFGRVVEKSRDVYGDSVNVAARVASLAKPDEIILTGEVVENLSSRLRRQAQYFDRANVKGKSVRTDFFRVVPRNDDATEISDVTPTPELHGPSLVLEFERREIVLRAVGGDFAIGRDKNCDLIVMGRFVSRRHSTIKCRRGLFFLVDHSANGTFVRYDGEEPIFLKREELQLHKSGSITLGEPLDSEFTEAISFRNKL